MNVVYFGTPQFAADVLETLLEQGVNVVAVVSRTDKPKGRSGTPVPTPVKQVALEKGIPVHQPVKVSAPEFEETLHSFDADLFVVVAYGEILKQHVLDAPRKGCINLHASLLPKYRGAAPIQRCIIDGEKESGVSIMYMVKKMDAGDVILKSRVPIGPDMTFGELEAELKAVGGDLLYKVVHRFETEIPDGEPQDESQVTFAPKIELEDCEIDWNRPANALHNLIRGVNPYPIAWCYVKTGGREKRLKILRSEVVDRAGAPGSILASDKNGVTVGCGDRALCLKQVQLEGKKAMPADALMRGISDIEFMR